MNWHEFCCKETGDILDWMREQGFNVNVSEYQNNWKCSAYIVRCIGMYPDHVFRTEATDEHVRTAILKVAYVCFSAMQAGVTLKES